MSVALKKQVDELESRTDSLETILGRFITSTNRSLLRLSSSVEDLKDEMKEFKDEMKDFKDEMKEFKDEMKDFKNEMKEFKDEAQRDRKKMNKKWGDLANKMGTLVEDFAIPNIPGIAEKYFNIKEFDFLAARIKKRNTKDRSIEKEFDVIAVSEKYIIVNETKPKFYMSFVKDFQETLAQIFDYFPEYSSKKIIPIFCSLYIASNDAAYLSKNKIFAMCMKDDTMELMNFDEISGNKSQ